MLGQRLRQMDRPATVAQDGGEDHLDPEGDRRLVERDEARRIERIVEEQPDALQHAAHAGSVVGGAETIVVQPHQPQGGNGQQHGAERRPFSPVVCSPGPSFLKNLRSLRQVHPKAIARFFSAQARGRRAMRDPRGSHLLRSQLTDLSRQPCAGHGRPCLPSRATAARRPLSGDGSTRIRNSGRSVGSLVNGQTVTKSFSPKRSSCTTRTIVVACLQPSRTAGGQSQFRALHSSFMSEIASTNAWSSAA